MGEWLDFIDEVVTVNGKGEKIKREKVTNRGYKYFLSKKVHLGPNLLELISKHINVLLTIIPSSINYRPLFYLKFYYIKICS